MTPKQALLIATIAHGAVVDGKCNKRDEIKQQRKVHDECRAAIREYDALPEAIY